MVTTMEGDNLPIISDDKNFPSDVYVALIADTTGHIKDKFHRITFGEDQPIQTLFTSAGYSVLRVPPEHSSNEVLL